MRHRRAPGVVVLLAAGAALVAVGGCTSAGQDRATGASAPPGGATPGPTTTGAAPTTATPTPPEPPAKVTVRPGPTSTLNPLRPIRVSSTGGRLRAVQVTDPHGGRVTGRFSDHRHRWTSTGDLAYATRYRVRTVGVNPDGRATQDTRAVSTVTPAKTAYAQVVPAPEIVGDQVGIGLPLGVQFTAPVTDRKAALRALHVTSTPAQPGAWHWIDDQHVHYRPKHFWRPGTTIRLTAHVFGKNLGGGVYGAADNAATWHVHDAWVARANGATKRMTVYHAGHQVRTLPISMGKPDMPTHTGIHVISSKQPKVIMDSCTFGVCKGPKAYKLKEFWDLRISNSGEYVHENPESVADQGSVNVSHGCINLSPKNARWFYARFGVGDVVEVTHSGGKPLPLWDVYGDWSLTWDQYRSGA